MPSPSDQRLAKMVPERSSLNRASKGMGPGVDGVPMF